LFFSRTDQNCDLFCYHIHTDTLAELGCGSLDLALEYLFWYVDAENAALFYDPKMDDEDQAWVNEKRESYRSSDPNRVTSSAHGKSIKEKKSDAVLNCPACMCTVCLDCQR